MKNDPLSQEEMEVAKLLRDPKLPLQPEKDSQVFLKEIEQRLALPPKISPWKLSFLVPAMAAASLLVFAILPNSDRLPKSSNQPDSIAEDSIAEDWANPQSTSMRQLAAISLAALEEQSSSIPSDQEELANLHRVIQTWSWDEDDSSEKDDEGYDTERMRSNGDSQDQNMDRAQLAMLEWEDSPLSEDLNPDSLDDGALLALHDALAERMN